jgi:transcriptional regulator with XRE-family HTH domain
MACGTVPELPAIGGRAAHPLTDSGAVMETAVPSGEAPDADREESLAEATVLRMLLGAQLRRLREAAGISAEKAGYEIRASRSKISRMETGRVGLKLRDIEDLLTLYGVADGKERAKVVALASRSREPEWWTQYNDILPDWFETYLSLESAATTIRSFETQFVPGLFQTEDYARAVTRLGHQTAPDAEIERRVRLRLARQDLLSRPRRPRIWAVMDESVLRRPIGGTAVMRAQLFRLAEAARLPGVRLQVIPFARGGHAAASGSFSLLRFEERDLPDVVYVEQLTSAVYLDQRADVEHYLEVVNQLSGEALTPADTVLFIEQAIKET